MVAGRGIWPVPGPGLRAPSPAGTRPPLERERERVGGRKVTVVWLIDPDRTTSWASAAASRSSRPSPNATVTAPGPRRNEPSRPGTARGPGGGYQRLTSRPGLRHEWSAAASASAGSRRAGPAASRAIRRPAASGDFLARVCPVQRLAPVQGQASKPAAIRAGD